MISNDGRTPLDEAIWIGKTFLFNQNQLIHFYSFISWSIFIKAENNDVTRVLIEYGADINSKDIDGHTSLQIAIYSGNYIKYG